MEHAVTSHGLSAVTLAGIIALAGYYFGIGARKLRLPSLIGYMMLGIMLGPSILNIFSKAHMAQLAFITDIALGFVAFSIGAELSLAELKRLGYGIILIIFAESFVAFFAVLFLLYFWTRDLPLSLVFASMAPASAPAGTVAIIQEYRARGTLTKALYAVVGFDDGLAIIIFGFAAALARSLLVGEATGHAESLLPALKAPALEIALSVLIGGVIALGFSQMVRRLQSGRDMLIIVFGAVLLATGISLRLHLSLILTNMVIGFVLVNTRREELVRKVVSPLLEVMPLLFVLFFCLAGAHLDLALLPKLGLLGLLYIVGRTSGLMGGAWLGATAGRSEPKLRKYLGFGILSQAGVAIGLSLIISKDFGLLSEHLEWARPAQIAASVLATITATCIFFEIIGPIACKFALERAGEIPHDAK